MRCMLFSRRTAMEILRDPLSILFGLGFPLVILLLLHAIQARIPVPLFVLENLTPGIAVFGASFLALFTATLVAKDRSSAFLQRLFTTPMTSWDFILGYTLPVIPMALAQSGIVYGAAVLLGLPVHPSILLCVLLQLPVSVFFIGLGLVFGTVLTEKQVGGICGAALTNLTAWLSGAWFDLGLVGGAFQRVAELLPFSHAVELGRAALRTDWSAVWPHFWPVSLYSAGAFALSCILFRRNMRGD